MAKTILLAIDHNSLDAATPPLREALALLGKEGVLHVVSVLPDFGLPQVAGFFREGYEKDMLALIGKRLDAWVSAQVPDDVDVHPHVLHGTIYDEILRAATALKADLIVIGAHRPELSDYLLGPNAARIVRHARQSVYVVRT